MKKRKSISKKIRFEVFKRDSFTCQYCGRKAPDVILEIDHIKPISKNGDNNILNYITSCYDCNRGKANIELDDKSIVKKQMKQLEELNKRREQLNMLFKWKECIENIDDFKLKKLEDYWKNKLNNQFSLNERGLLVFKNIINKYDIQEIIESIDISIKQYTNIVDGKFEHSSVEKAFNKIEPICRNRKKYKDKPYMKDIFYIRGILNNRFYLTKTEYYSIILLLEKLHLSDYNLEILKHDALNINTKHEYFELIHELLGDN